jgi:hypothetical protein
MENTIVNIKTQEKRQKWIVNNPEKYKIYCKKIFNQTPEERKAEKIKCKCGALIRRSGIRRHEKTKGHLEKIEKIKD